MTFSNLTAFSFIFIIIMCNGYMAQTNQPASTPARSLRIAVPVKAGLKEFVSIDNDSVTGQTTFNGFSIQVYYAVINTALSLSDPNPPQLELVPFAKPDGTMNGTYDDMLKAVFAKEYDGAVGDITIRFHRTKWVDFTMPYSETGVSMLVPVTNPHPHNKSTRISLMTFIKGLVWVTLAFCFFSALVFWYIEYRNDKRGQVIPQTILGANSQAQHSDLIKWQRETLRAIIHTRLVMVLWFLLLLFLTSCYTASLTSLFKSQRQRAPIRNLNQLIRNRENVGYQETTFVYELLIKAGFSEKQLISYNSEEEMLDMLSKGSKRGGVSAVVDEIPYLKLFLARHCNAYTLVPSVNFHADGFGFAFPKGSPLVSEISNAIIKVIDNGVVAKIQNRTIGDLDKCGASTSNTEADFNLLDSDTLWIVVAGAIGVTILVIILYVVYFGTVCGISMRSVAYPCYLLRRQ